MCGKNQTKGEKMKTAITAELDRDEAALAIANMLEVSVDNVEGCEVWNGVAEAVVYGQPVTMKASRIKYWNSL
jgi:hypothetical protein